MVPILTRVTLRQAVEHDDIGTWAILARVKRQIEASTPVIRAASAEITDLFVPADQIGAEAAGSLAQRLAAAFGVHAQAYLPGFTAQEWESRPEWMRTEPWRTKYAVDAMLAVRATG